MFEFGIGAMIGIPNGGNQGTPTGPQLFGTIQDTSVEFDQKLVELRGQKKYPDDVAPGDMTVKGKSGFAFLDVNIYNALYFADTVTTGIQVILSGDTAEAHPIPGSGPFTVVVTHTTGFIDGGVINANTGQRFTLTTGTPTAGQYAVNAGTATYTFAAADTGIAVLISYIYTDASTGKTLTVNNHTQGYGPTFELWLQQPYQGANGLHLYKCRASKMSAPMKRDGYVISDFEFEGYANAAGKVFDWFQATI